MLINAEIVGDIAQIILEETQGNDRQPDLSSFNVEDLGNMWLVTGHPHDDGITGMRYNVFYMHIDKETCEVFDVGFQSRFILSPSEEIQARKEFGDSAFERLFGEPKQFSVGGPSLDLCKAFYGGVINSIEGAIKFADIIIGTHRHDLRALGSSLQAEEIDGLWHIHANSQAGDPLHRSKCILTFSRDNAKVTSFDF